MYYEEEVINGVLMYRTRPDGVWREMPNEFAQVIEQLRKDNQRFIEMLNHLGIDPAEDGGPTGEWVPAMEIQQLQRDKAELVDCLIDVEDSIGQELGNCSDREQANSEEALLFRIQELTSKHGGRP